MGRPSEYNGKSVVYGLHDGAGTIFYVGKSTCFAKRLTAYRCGETHRNRRLAKMLKDYGLHWVILSVDPEDLHAAEFDQIEARKGLVNVITHRDMKIIEGKSDKPWVIPGVKSPTAQYMHTMRNRFGSDCVWMRQELEKMDDERRLTTELNIAALLIMKGADKARRWMNAIEDKYRSSGLTA